MFCCFFKKKNTESRVFHKVSESNRSDRKELELANEVGNKPKGVTNTSVAKGRVSFQLFLVFLNPWIQFLAQVHRMLIFFLENCLYHDRKSKTEDWSPMRRKLVLHLSQPRAWLTTWKKQKRKFSTRIDLLLSPSIKLNAWSKYRRFYFYLKKELFALAC